jgi:hypothetical protein
MRWLLAPTTVLLLLVSPGVLAAMQVQTPGLTVSTPTDGAQLTGTTVRVEFQATNFTIVPTTVPVADAGKRPEVNRPGEGHVHFQLDLTPLVVHQSGEAYTFTNVPAGEHLLMVELVHNDHASLSPRVMREVRFQVAPGMPRSGMGGGLRALPAAGGALLIQAATAEGAGDGADRWQVPGLSCSKAASEARN